MTTNDSNTVGPMLAAVFAERPISVIDAERREQRRRETILRIESVVKAEAPVRRNGHRVYFIGVMAAAALAAGFALVVGRLNHQPVASRFFQTSGIIECQALSDKQWAACSSTDLSNVVGLKTQVGAEATIDTPDGVRIALESASVIGIVDPVTSRYAHQITLSKGRIQLLVPKLGNGQFAVVTPNATITVHGTAFSVEVEPGAGAETRTCLRLHEGIVSVQSAGRNERLVAPAIWGCSDHSDAPSPAGVAAKLNLGATRSSNESSSTDSGASSRRAPSRPNSSVAERSSTLEQETKLLQRALGAEQRGDFVAARQGFKQLLSQYPNSVVVPEARAALERVEKQQRRREH